METTINSTKTIERKQTISKNVNSKFWDKVEFNRYGIISMLVLITGCLGGICAAFGAHNNALEIGLIVFPTIIALAMILAVAPMRIIVYLCSLAIILDFIVLIF
jgi:hypothetical protein